MDWFKAIMIFMAISFGGVLVYVCATLENLVTEYGNLKAQIKTLKNGRTETITDIFDRQDAIIELVDNDFKRTLRIYDSMSNIMHKLTLRMKHLEKRLNEIEITIENRAKETSRVFDAVQNDINEIRSEWRALKEDYGELWEGTDAHIEPFILDALPEFGSLKHSRCAVKEENLTDLEVEAPDQK